MARPGVTYQDIVLAVTELTGQGKSITIENIRAYLGTGSIGTINKYLRQWREAQHSIVKAASQNPIPDELVTVLKGLWERVMTQSAEQFIPLEETLRQEVIDLKEEVEKYRSNNQRWQKLFDQWQQEKTTLENEKITLEQALEFSHKENTTLHTKQEGLFQQLQEKQYRIDELHKLYQQIQTNLEHDREINREQRLLDQRQFEQQKSELQTEIKSQLEQITFQRDQVAEQQQKYLLLQQSYHRIEKDLTQLQQQFEITQFTLAESEKNKNEYFYACQHWQQQNKELQNNLNDQSRQLIEIQAENKLLCREIDNIRKELKNANEKAEWFSQEKIKITEKLKRQKEVSPA